MVLRLHARGVAHLPSDTKEMVCASECSQSTFLQNGKLYHGSKPYPPKNAVERIQPQDGSTQSCIKASFIPWVGNQKLMQRS